MDSSPAIVMAWCRSVQTPDDYLISSSDVTTCGHGNNYHTIIKLFSTTYNIILIAHGACGCAARVTRDTWRGDSKTRGVRAQTARLTRGWEYFGYFRNICSIFVAHKRQAETFMLFSPMWPRVWRGCCRWGWERSDDDRKLAPTPDCDSPDTNGSICGDQPRFANITPEHAKTLLQKYLHKSHNGHRVSRAWAATSTVCRGRQGNISLLSLINE